MNIKTKIITALTLAVLVAPGITFAQTTSVASLQAEINALLAQVQTLETQLATAGGSTAPWCYTFSTNLSIGMSGPGVTALQAALQKDGESVTVNGTFDDQTAAAVTGFQEKYSSAILAPYGLSNGTGYAGKSTRAELNSLFGCAGSGPGGPILPPITVNPVTPALTATPTSTYYLSPSSGPVGTITKLSSPFSGNCGTANGCSYEWLQNGSVVAQNVPNYVNGVDDEFQIPSSFAPGAHELVLYNEGGKTGFTEPVASFTVVDLPTTVCPAWGCNGPEPIEPPFPVTASTSVSEVQNLTATASGTSVNLSWSAATSTDNFWGYDVSRDTTSSFNPSAYRIARGNFLSYTDSDLPQGTYYYIVTAEDVNGNIGPASEVVTVTVPATTTTPTSTTLDVAADGCVSPKYHLCAS